MNAESQKQKRRFLLQMEINLYTGFKHKHKENHGELWEKQQMLDKWTREGSLEDNIQRYMWLWQIIQTQKMDLYQIIKNDV